MTYWPTDNLKSRDASASKKLSILKGKTPTEMEVCNVMNVYVTICWNRACAHGFAKRLEIFCAHGKEIQSNGRAHDCDHAQIFCAHGLIHEHRKSRVIGVHMAMCTSKPIIGKCAPGAGGRKLFAVCCQYHCFCLCTPDRIPGPPVREALKKDGIF